MSRVLADLLGAKEPDFSFRLKKLETQAGFPRADIRLSLDIQQKVRTKFESLKLDPKSTTGLELYRALEVKLMQDDKTVREVLGLNEASSEHDMLAAVQKLLAKETAKHKVFAVKQVVVRNILKKLKPKATMKALGYRSMDSMFKHEPVAQLVAATEMLETAEWHKARFEAYKKLRASDFELRMVQFYVPTGKKWPELADRYTRTHHHTIVTVAELGGVLLLPSNTILPAETILTVLIGLRAVNDIRSLSTLLKLQQVRPDFGDAFLKHLVEDYHLDFGIFSEQKPWSLAHWFYSSGRASYHLEEFGPHLQADDFYRHDTHATLAGLHDALRFWQGSSMLAHLDGRLPISFNALDVALGVCNGLSYANRVVHYMRESLERELTAAYMQVDSMQAKLAETLSAQLVPEYEFDM